jgi:DNA uptake protein ComE-like DNA-binding protein
VDLNKAPAPVIARICEIDLVSAQNIVDGRSRLGGSFSNVDEAFVVTQRPVSAWDRIRDRAVLVS